MLTVRGGARESVETTEKELLPKLVIYSVLLAGPMVKSHRTVLINFPSLSSCAISSGSRGNIV